MTPEQKNKVFRILCVITVLIILAGTLFLILAFYNGFKPGWLFIAVLHYISAYIAFSVGKTWLEKSYNRYREAEKTRNELLSKKPDNEKNNKQNDEKQ